MTISNQSPWVIFRLLEQVFAVTVDQVREMVKMPKIVSLPQMPAYVRGVINLRDKVLPILDLRVKLGMSSLQQETKDLVSLLEQREQDHKNWIKELESSVKETREFKLATDPHKCAFGLWYDNFTTVNRILDTCLKKFDTPHKKIHAIAIEVKAYVEKDDFDTAFKVIDQTKNHELAQMVTLFAEARRLLLEDQKEIALVIEYNNSSVVLAVDAIESIEKLSLTEIEDLPDITTTIDNDCIAAIGKRMNEKGLVQLMDIDSLLKDTTLHELTSSE